MRQFLATALAGLGLLIASSPTVDAAEVKVISGTATRGMWEELAPAFEIATGHKLDIWYGNNATIKQRMEAEEPFDLFVSGPSSLKEYTTKGKIAADTHTEIARVGMGVGARAGTPKLDISSIDKFKRALLDAKSITYNPRGAVGIQLSKVFERLGITDEMKAKAILQQESGLGSAQQTVISGKADFMFAFTNQILFSNGLELVGPFPPELQRTNVYIAGVATAAKEPGVAKELIKFLRSPAAVAVIKAKGMEPASGVPYLP